MTSTTPIIELRNVSRIFRTETVETHALREINLQIDHGEFVAIMGPSGSGKSTLLNVIGLLDRVHAGNYILDGRATQDLGAAERAALRNCAIGFVFQAFNLIGELTACENVALPFEFRGTPKRRRMELAAAALHSVGMAHRLGHFPSQLSGGQQQRVAIARALAGKPGLLLADEPTGNLDSKSGNAVMDLLQAAHRAGTTVVMVTHSDHCASLASRRIRMLDGKLLPQQADTTGNMATGSTTESAS